MVVRMKRKLPTVMEGRVYDPARPDRAIVLDSPAWFVWLEAATTKRFSYPLFDPRVGYSVGFMTVRKERRERGGWYWSVFRRAGTRVHKIYLGRTATLTHTRLAAVAERIRTGQQV